MKNSSLQLAIIATVFGIVVGSTRGVEGKVYTAYISDAPDTSIAYWVAKEAGFFKKQRLGHGIDLHRRQQPRYPEPHRRRLELYGRGRDLRDQRPVGRRGYRNYK